MSRCIILTSIVTILGLVSGCGGADNESDRAAAARRDALQVALDARVDVLTRESTVANSQFAALQGQFRAFQESTLESRVQTNMAIDGFQRDIERLRIEIDGLHAERTMVNAILERIPLDTRLGLKTDLHVVGTLEDVLTRISRQSGIPIRVVATDLQEEMIPTIRQLDLHYTDATFEHILGDVMLKGNLYPTEANTLSDPKLKLVYVIANADPGGRQQIVVTTRKRASERGMLSAAFQVK